MAFWSRLFGDTPNHAGVVPNSNGPSAWSPGDPEGVTVETPEPVELRSFPVVMPSPWDGWPAEWSTPQFNMTSQFNTLIDVAWMCLDKNASVLATMPVYRTRAGQMLEPTTWMTNPDPMIYTSWHEFAKQAFWDYQLGETFILPMARGADGFPLSFRVVPPWLVNVEMRGGRRVYNIGALDVTDEILHIRYKSTTDSGHGVGPLESAGARMITAGVLTKYVREVASTGGVPYYTLNTDIDLSPKDSQKLLDQWVETRKANLGAPPVLDNGVTLQTHQSMSPKDMTMFELSQFTEARIAELLGVPGPLVGLPTGDSLTYSNITSLFDFHDRASLRPKATDVMAALSFWALPRGQAAELNRDEYTRPAFNERAESWVKLKDAGIVSADEVRAAERFAGDAPASDGLDDESAAVALTGGDLS
jgi:HK97 family phage portal protein